MVGLYKDPKGENIFTNSKNTDTTMAITIKNTKNEDDLKKKIAELQDEVKEKDVRKRSH